MKVEYITAHEIRKSLFEAVCPFCGKCALIEKIRRFTKISVSIEYKLNVGCSHCYFFDPATKVVMFVRGDENVRMALEKL